MKDSVDDIKIQEVLNELDKNRCERCGVELLKEDEIKVLPKTIRPWSFCLECDRYRVLNPRTYLNQSDS